MSQFPPYIVHGEKCLLSSNDSKSLRVSEFIEFQALNRYARSDVTPSRKECGPQRTAPALPSTPQEDIVLVIRYDAVLEDLALALESATGLTALEPRPSSRASLVHNSGSWGTRRAGLLAGGSRDPVRAARRR